MESNRLWPMVVLAAALVFAYACLILVYWRYHPLSRTQVMGFGAGLGVGSLLCLYLRKTWDPVHLRPVNPHGQQGAGCWLFVAGTGGVILTRMTTTFLGVHAEEFLVGGLLASLTMIMGYMIIQAWRHRPRWE